MSARSPRRARPGLPGLTNPLRGPQGRAEGPGPGRSPRSVPRARGGSGGHDRGGPSGPAPARPLAAPPRSPHAVTAGGGAPRASRRRPHRPYGAFTFLVRHGEAGGARRPRGARRGGLGEAGGRFLRSLLRPLRPRLPSIVSCPRCVRLPAPRTPSRAKAAQSAPAAGRRRPISGGQGGRDRSARDGHVAGVPLPPPRSRHFPERPQRALKGAAPRAEGRRVQGPLPVPDLEEPVVADPPVTTAVGRAYRGGIGADRCVCGPRSPSRTSLTPSGILGVLLILCNHE